MEILTDNSQHFIKTNNSNNNINDPIKIEVSEFKFNDVKNEPKPFGFHIGTINIPISVVLIKRVWKKRGKITKHAWKKTFKTKTKDKQGTKIEADVVQNTKYIKEVQTIDPTEFTGDRKWCWDEFERHIGVPERTDTRPSTAITYIRMKSDQRFVLEAKNLRKPKQNDAVFLATEKPITNCLCPDHECLCFGRSIINETREIPNNQQRVGYLQRFLNMLNIPVSPSPKTVNVKAFIKKLVEATSASAKENNEIYNKVILNQELCLGRCRNCDVTGTLHDIQYQPSFIPVTQPDDSEAEPRKPDDGLDDRVCNVVYCTVSSQTDTTADGELNMGKFSHLLFSNNKETYLNDIRGNKLQISHYTHVCPKSPDKQVCVQNMEKLLNFKEIKTRLSNFICSIYQIKDPGTPVRNRATQVPWRHTCDSFKIRAPNRCGDEDYENLKEVPWNFKFQEAIIDEITKNELEEEDNDDVCSCCEYFAGSDIDKETLLDEMRNVLTLPRDVTISKNQLTENITIVKKIIEEVVANAFDDVYENMIKKQKIEKLRKKKNNKNKKDKDEESVDEDILDNNEMIAENDNSKLQSSFIDAGKASEEIKTEETGNDKKRVKCDFLRPKRSTILSSSKSVAQKISESVARRIHSMKNNVTIAKRNSFKKQDENDNNRNEINPVLKQSDDQGNLEISKDLSGTKEINNKSSTKNSKIVKEQKVASDKHKTSKDKVVLQVHTSYKKASSAFSSLFKWLFDQSIILSEVIKTSSAKSVSKDKLSTDDTNLNEEDSKNSEREVFSIRYTSSTISVNKSSNLETDK